MPEHKKLKRRRGRPRGKMFSVDLRIKFDHALLAEIDAVARKLHWSRSALIRAACAQYAADAP